MARVAIVTGGGSGIGEALCRALAARGDTVVVADIDAPAAERVAADLGSLATAAKVDVRDAAGVQAVVDDTVAQHGRLDLMFNNAGIGVGGDVLELTLAHWDRIIDINLRGVVHGVQAAYPVMARQRSGSIVNTASMAGLTAPAYMTPYVTTKHAVVGLSMALRAEAKAHGVNVTVVCPFFVDTPILDSFGPEDLPKPPSLREGLRPQAQKLGIYSPQALAQDVLRGVDRKRAMVVAPRRGRVLWRRSRVAPAAFGELMGVGARREMKRQQATG
jgi:NAD(P)-dependent dehydrogenase (short-subunit alcohol dehydrogenase family)